MSVGAVCRDSSLFIREAQGETLPLLPACVDAGLGVQGIVLA